MTALGKFNLGIKTKKNFFDFSHDVNTTSDFGFCQPTLIDLVQPGSNVKLTTKQFIRLAPLPTPTFGRVKVHTDNMFIPLRDVCPAFDNLMSQTAISARTSYIPSTLDYISKDWLMSYLIAMSNHYGRLGEFDKCPFRFSFISKMPLSSDETGTSQGTIQYRDIINDSTVVNNPARCNTAYEFLYDYFAPRDATYAQYSFWSHWSDIFGVDAQFDPSRFNIGTGEHDTHQVNYPSLFNFLTNTAERQLYTQIGASGTYPLNYHEEFNYINKWQGVYVRENFVTNVVNGRNELNSPITLNNADYIIKISGDYQPSYTLRNADGTISQTVISTLHDAFLCLKLTRFGRRLMRIFTATRQNPFGRYNDDIALAPLFAYYKAWFDFYNPARVTNWELTPAYYLIHYFYDYGRTADIEIGGWHTTPFEYGAKFRDFLLDLGKCCYVLPIDNVSVVTDTVESNVQTDVNYLQWSSDNTSEDISTLSVGDGLVYGSSEADSWTSQGGLGIKVLERVYHWTSENSVIGKKVRDYLKKYNILLPKTNVLGRDQYMCEISDVFSTAETTEGYLGEYAGKGLGTGQTSLSMEDVKEYGYIVQLFSIAPHAGYVQGDCHHPLTRMDFYQPEFDSLGKEPVAMSEVFNRHTIISDKQGDFIFGFRPRYFGLKFRNNIANGYFAERSSRSQYLPYSLDRLFAEKDIELYNNGCQYRESTEFVPYAGEDIRFVGIDESCGLYDRIFYENDGLVDNFIVHILQDYKVWSPMKPIADSYDSFDKDVHDSTTEVEHS